MFCMNCGAQLPSGAKFCLNCGAEIKITDSDDSRSAVKNLTEPAPDREGTIQQHKDDSVLTAITKFKQQMKLAFLPLAVCGIITIFYALSIPTHRSYTLTTMMEKDFPLMIGIFIFGVVLFITCVIIATKRLNAALALSMTT